MMETEIIKKRIKKLLALSKSSNENEAVIALKKANDLMAEYAIDRNQIIDFNEIKVKGTKKFNYWRYTLCLAIEELYATCHLKNGKDGTIHFFGDELDVFMSTEMYNYLVGVIQRMTKVNCKNKGRFYSESYRIGIVNKLYDRMKELGERCSWRNREELKRQQKQVSKFIETQYPVKYSKSCPRSYNIVQSAYNQGTSDGEKVNLNRQMTNQVSLIEEN